MDLRDFLYLDRPLVRDFLAQVEGGLVDEITEKQMMSGKRGIGGKFGVGSVGVDATKSKESSVESEAVVRQVAASEFDRLYSHLRTEDLVVLDEVSDAGALSQLRRKQFLEVDARVQVSGIHRLMSLITTFAAIAPVMEQLGADIGADQETLAGMQAISGLTGSSRSVPVIATVAGAAGLKVGLELTPASVLTDAWDVDASVLLKVQRVIKSDERYVVGDPFGGLLKLVPNREREKFMESLKSSDIAQLEIGDVEITAPALLGTPIAIYR